jgi:hypothetical protein
VTSELDDLRWEPMDHRGRQALGLVSKLDPSRPPLAYVMSNPENEDLWIAQTPAGERIQATSIATGQWRSSWEFSLTARAAAEIWLGLRLGMAEVVRTEGDDNTEACGCSGCNGELGLGGQCLACGCYA